MSKEANNAKELNFIRIQIEVARLWAMRHFNPDYMKSDDFFSSLFFVEFPEPDIMKVYPSLMGIRGSLSILYRLHFVGNGNLVWTPEGFPNLPSLIVTGIPVADIQGIVDRVVDEHSSEIEAYIHQSQNRGEDEYGQDVFTPQPPHFD